MEQAVYYVYVHRYIERDIKQNSIRCIHSNSITNIPYEGRATPCQV